MEEKIKVEVDSGKEFEAFIDREYKDGLNKTSTLLEIESPKMRIFAENQSSSDNPENFVKVVFKDEFTKENAGEMIEKVKDIFQEYNLAYEKNVLVLDSEDKVLALVGTDERQKGDKFYSEVYNVMNLNGCLLLEKLSAVFEKDEDGYFNRIEGSNDIKIEIIDKKEALSELKILSEAADTFEEIPQFSSEMAEKIKEKAAQLEKLNAKSR